MRLTDAITGAAMALALSIQPGCTTYRHDRPDCAAVGLFDQPPHGCWCSDDAPPRCADATALAADIEREMFLHFDPAWIGVNDKGQWGVHKGHRFLKPHPDDHLMLIEMLEARP